jgi:hypothetical protein
VATFTLPPGGVSNDPFENSFFLEIFQRDEVGRAALLPAGANPNALSAVASAVVGSDFEAQVDLGMFPPNSRSFAAVTTASMPGQMTALGILVLDLSTVIMPLGFSATGLHTLPIPLDANLVGVDFFMQGAVETTGAGCQLTNALSLSIGTL